MMLEEIKQRYTAESTSCSNLSCGSNVQFLDLKAGETVLDLGCGRGAETMEAAALAGPAGKAVGLDLTEAMIEAAEKDAAERGVANVAFTAGNIEALPFEEKTFDAVMSNCVINHAEDKQRAYREIFRVLKENGRFVISDAVTREALPESVKNDPAAWAQCFGGAVTEAEYLASIRAAGFPKVEILKRREYLKNSYEFISLTIRAVKQGA